MSIPPTLAFPRPRVEAGRGVWIGYTAGLIYVITRRKNWNRLRRGQQTLHRLGHCPGLGGQGATLAFTYQGERVKENVEELAGTFGADTLILPCDVTKDEDIARVFKAVGEKFGKLHLLLHSVAFAPKDALEGEFVNTSREAFRIAHDVSAYSLVALARAAAPLMTDGGSIVAMSYYGAEKVVPHYNVMGVAKASLEASTRYLAYDLGPKKIRVNCISAGPVNTLAARGISGFMEMLKHYEAHAPAQAQRHRPRNSAPPASSSPATAPPPSPARCSTWTAATRSWGCSVVARASRP